MTNKETYGIPTNLLTNWKLKDFWKICEISTKVNIINYLTLNDMFTVIWGEQADYELKHKYDNWYIRCIGIKDKELIIYICDDISKSPIIKGE